MVLPVVLLAAVGLWAVVRELRLAKQESLRQCQQAAGTLARRLRSELEAEFREYLLLANEHWIHFRVISSIGGTAWPAPDEPPRNLSLEARMADWEKRHPTLSLRDLALDTVGVATNGNFITLPDWPSMPAPPAWFARLSPEKSSLLRGAEALEAVRPS